MYKTELSNKNKNISLFWLDEKEKKFIDYYFF